MRNLTLGEKFIPPILFISSFEVVTLVASGTFFVEDVHHSRRVFLGVIEPDLFYLFFSFLEYFLYLFSLLFVQTLFP